MENWRPKEGWDAKQILLSHNMKNTLFSHRYAVEIGFDACLEALRDARFPYPQGQFAGIDITKEGDFLIILKS